MASKKNPVLPCCLVVKKDQWVLVDGRDGREEWHCPTCGKLCAEFDVMTRTLKFSRNLTALIEAQEGYGPASNPAPDIPLNLMLTMDRITGPLEVKTKRDFKKAVKWYHLVAGEGNPAAQVNLGVLYAGGALRPMIAYMWVAGPPQDNKEAVRWFRLAAEQGNASAQFNLGVMCYTGEGVPQDIEEAARWFRLAAEQGKAVAQYNLGALYGNGLGVMQDCVQALMWLILAATQDNKEAGDARESFSLQMTSSQIEEAERLAREWKPKK